MSEKKDLNKSYTYNKHNSFFSFSSINKEFEESLRHKNLIFSNGIDLIYEFFNLERKSKNSILGKTVQYLGKNSNVNDFFTKIADRGFIL